VISVAYAVAGAGVSWPREGAGTARGIDRDQLKQGARGMACPRRARDEERSSYGLPEKDWGRVLFGDAWGDDPRDGSTEAP
jgi:hypothetical protein